MEGSLNIFLPEYYLFFQNIGILALNWPNLVCWQISAGKK
jgi:hypothetical protein